MNNFDLIIVGGGVAGSFSALLAAMNGLRVCVVEASNYPNGATSRSGGVVTRMLDNRFDRRLSKLTVDIFNKFIRCDCLKYGYLCIEDEKYAFADIRNYREEIPDIRVLGSDEVIDRWGFLRLYGDEVGLYAPSDFTVDPESLLIYLWNRIQDLGCEILRGHRVIKIVSMGNRVRFIELANGSRIIGDNYFLCAGPWNKFLIESIGIKWRTWLLGIPIFKFMVRGDYDLVGVWDEYIYSYWRPGDHSLIGGVYDAFDISEPSQGFARPSMQNVNNVVEGFKYRFNFDEWKLVKGWSGPISITKNYRPVFDAVDGFSNLYVIDGLGGRGLMRGPAVAYLLLKKIGIGVSI